MLKLAKSKHLGCVVDQIASVSGSTGDYDLTLDNGEVITGYDETAGSFDTAAPVADDYACFGILGGTRNMTAADCEVIKEAVFNNFMLPIGS